MAYALSRRELTLQEISLKSMGIDNFKDMYADDEDFADIYKVCAKYKNHFHSRYVEYTLQSDFFFKGN